MSCGVTGPEFVGAGQVIIEAVTVRVFVGPVIVCVGPVTVMIVVTMLVTGGSVVVIVLPL